MAAPTMVPAPPSTPDAPACPACQPCASLPSSETMMSLVEGDGRAGLMIGRDLFGRSILVAFGGYCFGGLPFWQAVAGGFGGGLMIEASVAAYTLERVADKYRRPIDKNGRVG